MGSQDKIERYIAQTKDGSHTLVVPALNEQYHSIHGAKQESEHVFLKMGLGFHSDKKALRVFEVGFGTGLNALLSAIYARNNNLKLQYCSVEKYPLTIAEADGLNYGELVGEVEIFKKMHQVEWAANHQITPNFELTKLELDVTKDQIPIGMDVIFFDAFAPNKQPKLWSDVVFEKMYQTLNQGGCLVTYCCQGEAKRTMKRAGFEVEKVQGPPGKREMLRAIKK